MEVETESVDINQTFLKLPGIGEETDVTEHMGLTEVCVCVLFF